MTPFRDLPIRRKLITSLLLTSSVALALASVAFLAFEWFSVRKAMVEDLRALAVIIGANSTAALSFNDPSAVQETLAALRSRSDVELACIYAELYGYKGRLFAFYRSSAAESSCPGLPEVRGPRFEDRRLTMFLDVRLNEEKVGALYLSQNLDALWTRMRLQLEVIGATLLVASAAAYGLAFFLQRFLSRPVLRLAEMAREISQTQDYSIRGRKLGEDEIGFLTDRINEMLKEIHEGHDMQRRLNASLERGIEERTRANEELQSALLQLQETQDHLIQTEKLASLGSMVAGVAHEINTPVGVSVTASSHLMDQTQALRGEFDNGALKRSRLEHFLDVAEQSTRIILSNLNRALELIQSFKQVAVDQSTSERREFDLREYLEEILLSLEPEIRRAGHKVELNCPDGCVVYSVPGAVSGIITNLLMNAIVHAYDEGQHGHIRIEVQLENDQVRLRFRDDGKGIPAEHLPRVFDPFFTTQPGRGGSGLGLHIVYNLVSQTLGGRVRVASEPGKGAEFLITFPIGQGERIKA